LHSPLKENDLCRLREPEKGLFNVSPTATDLLFFTLVDFDWPEGAPTKRARRRIWLALSPSAEISPGMALKGKKSERERGGGESHKGRLIPSLNGSSNTPREKIAAFGEPAFGANSANEEDFSRSLSLPGEFFNQGEWKERERVDQSKCFRPHFFLPARAEGKKNVPAKVSISSFSSPSRPSLGTRAEFPSKGDATKDRRTWGKEAMFEQRRNDLFKRERERL